MSVSLLEVIEAGGYDLTTREDNLWLLSKAAEFEELIEKAQFLVDQYEEIKSAIIEKKYMESFPKGDE